MPAWIAGALYAQFFLPHLQTTTQDSFIGAIPNDLPALNAERHAVEEFGVPVLTRTIIVSRYDRSLSPTEQVDLLAQNLQTSSEVRQSNPGFLTAVPVSSWMLGGGNHDSTVIISYLFFGRGAGPGEQVAVARQFRDRISAATSPDYAGVTGAFPAGIQQSRDIRNSMNYVEIAAIAAMVSVVFIRFHAIGAAAVTLATVGISYAIAFAVLQQASIHFGMNVPTAAGPLLSVLLLGIVTDYVTFYLGSFREAYGDTNSSTEASAVAIARVTKSVATACLVVVAGALTLLAASLVFLPQLAPGLAIALAIGFLIASTFAPCLMAFLGRAVLWPYHEGEAKGSRQWNAWMEGHVIRPIIGVPVIILMFAILAFGAYKAGDAHLGVNLIDDLPAGSEPSSALTTAESDGIPPGAIAPTSLVLQQPGIARKHDALANLQSHLQDDFQTSRVFGPRDVPAGVNEHVLSAPDEGAVRFLIVFPGDPYGSKAIDDFREIKDRMPALLAGTDLQGADISFTGDTALSAQLVNRSVSDSFKVSGLLLGAEFLILLVFTRALVTSGLLVIIAGLVALSALGVTALISGAILASTSLTFYVPITVAALILSLSSDYNLFLIGQIWQERDEVSLREAIARGGPRASWAILTASFALALSFMLLAIVPVEAFRELAIGLSAGVLIDTLLVRPLLLPALLSTLNRFSTWPSQHAPSGWSYPIDS